jgi:ankyrin repeat protein
MNFDEAQKAIKKGDALHIRHYLESGLDPNLSNRFGATLLMVAAFEGNTAIGRDLILHGAQLDARDSHGWTALCTAVHTGHLGFVELLVDAGASLDGQAFGSSIKGFLDWALMYGSGSKDAMRKMKPLIESVRASRRQSESKGGASV